MEPFFSTCIKKINPDMNRIILLPMFILSILFSSNAEGQIKGNIIFPDDDSLYSQAFNDSSETNLKIINFSDTKFYYFKSWEMFVFKTKKDTERFIDSTKSVAPIGFDKIDFENNTLVLFSYHGGDCHATFSYGFKHDDAAKTFTVKVYDFYGGCRAGGLFKTDWALIPKLPEDYKAEFVSIMVK